MMEIITRAQAKAHKPPLKRYFTGKACKHGHICERFTSGGHCIECLYPRVRADRAVHREERNAKGRARREAHREEWNAKKRARRQAHLEEERARSRAYHEAHREEDRTRSRTYDAAHREERKVKGRIYNVVTRNNHSELAALHLKINEAARLLRERLKHEK